MIYHFFEPRFLKFYRTLEKGKSIRSAVENIIIKASLSVDFMLKKMIQIEFKIE